MGGRVTSDGEGLRVLALRALVLALELNAWPSPIPRVTSATTSPPKRMMRMIIRYPAIAQDTDYSLFVMVCHVLWR